MAGEASADELCAYFNGVPVIGLTGLAEGSAEVQRIRDRCANVLKGR